MSSQVGELGPGEHEVKLGGRFRAGLYLVRLRQDPWTQVVRAAVVE